MAHIGKISCHHPGVEPNPNHDVYGITYAPPGAQSQSDLLNINKVIYLSPADITAIQNLPTNEERLAYIQDSAHRVWELIASLTAGTQTVVFEYTPSTDISLTSLGIFTDSTDTNTTCNVAIYHESGLVVYKHNADTIDSTETVCDLQGKKRHINGISGVTLKGGLKYYVQYTQETDSNHTTFYPAYFSGVAGNYKVWYHGSVQNKQTVNMANFNKYWGLLDDSSRIFGMDEGDFFIWNGAEYIGMTAGYCYVRSNVGQTYTFTGIVGDPASHYRPVTSADIVAILQRPANCEFIWYIHQQSGMNFGEIWAKTDDTSSWASVTHDQSNYGLKEFAEVLIALKNSTTAVTAFNGQQAVFSSGDKVTLKTGYISCIESTTPLADVPSNPQNNGIYLVTHNYNDAIACYSNGSWSYYTDFNTVKTQFCNVTALSSWLTYVANNSDLISTYYDTNRIAATLRDNDTYPIQTDRKYYLEINGKEV